MSGEQKVHSSAKLDNEYEFDEVAALMLPLGVHLLPLVSVAVSVDEAKQAKPIWSEEDHVKGLKEQKQKLIARILELKEEHDKHLDSMDANPKTAMQFHKLAKATITERKVIAADIFAIDKELDGGGGDE